MKPLPCALVLPFTLSVLVTAQAQSLEKPLAGVRAVSSPNKTQFSTLSSSSQKPNAPNTTVSAIALIDSMGKNIGRLFATDLAILPYNGDFMSAAVAQQENKLGWRVQNSWVYYASADCSGPAYGNTYYVPGARYVGLASEDQSGAFMLVMATSASSVTIMSMYGNDGRGAGWGCFAVDPYTSEWLPVVGSAPLSNFGVPPFTIR